MKKWVTRIISAQQDTLADKEVNDFAAFAHEMGYEYLDINSYQRGAESYEALTAHIDGFLAGVQPGDLLIYQYPSHIDAQFEVTFIERTAYQGIQIMPVLHDYHHFHQLADDGFHEARLMTMANAAIIPTAAAGQLLRQQGVGAPYILQECWDFKTDTPFHAALPEKKVVVAADQDAAGTSLPDSIRVVHAQTVDKLIAGLPNGFGLARQTDDSYRIPPEVMLYLALGMPVFVWQGTPIAQLVADNHLGYVIQSADEIQTIFAQIGAKELWELQTRAQAFGQLLRTGYFTRQTLLKAEHFFLNRDWHLKSQTKPQPIDGIHVMDISDTITYILDNHPSVARFGDGEFDVIRGGSIPYQTADASLAKRLKQVLAYQSNQDLLICLPDIFGNLDKFKPFMQPFWRRRRGNVLTMFKDIDTSGFYGTTDMSRPYFSYEDRAQAGPRFTALKKIWQDQDLLIVEGKLSRSGEDNDLFANAHSIERILCPAQNAYAKIDAIEAAIEQYGENKLILLMLGPTAKVIVYDLFQKGFWLIDSGHMDSEYEWYRRGARLEKIKIPHKHTAEFNYDAEDLEQDSKFDAQVVADLSD
ncbi:hypothetical protein IV38_GL001914 [Lactobacillus selangorensis]|uniref:Uncharacterized protein n=1 Tax=Lactobacillus selangorensis TaxID=81857 RepID=A0A0R2FQE5_9LACO|nr:SP_1767 family glycosyltransferase [Lactobacillus selangorensis]KRN27701.1 hypothetical protein IV38_GL001914 [Lactobacillus selangorensis]KRN30334.1 hypothetical protein IV40_GL001923 [Lactobacillus selangorensis]